MTGQIHYQRSPQVRFRIIDGEGVALLQDTGEMILVNETGALILELLQRAMSVSELVHEMAERVDAPVEVLNIEIPQFLEELETAGAVQRSGSEEMDPPE